VLESSLFGSATFERLLDARDFTEQKRVLADTEYGRFMEGVETSTDVEASLDVYMTELYAFVESAGLPEAVVRFFRLGDDYANLKGRLKADAVGTTVDELLVGHGTVEREVFEGPYEAMPRFLRDAAAPLLDTDGGIVSEELIDPAVDKAMFADLLDAAEESKSASLLEGARLMVDIANLKTLVRAKNLGWTPVLARGALIEGGTVEPELLMVSYARPVEELAERVAVKGAFRSMEVAEIIDVRRLDVATDNLLMEYARRMRRVATGVDPVIGYVIARRSEVRILRMLLLGKIAGMSAEALRRRLRELYG
jgi:V/A-type H+-transporting ATPase subunit C